MEDTMKMKPHWILSLQQKAVLEKYPGPVAWVNYCQLCGKEEPVYEGPLNVAIYQSSNFISIHKGCGRATSARPLR
jgi:hypothetical protein